MKVFFEILGRPGVPGKGFPQQSEEQELRGSDNPLNIELHTVQL